MSVHTGNGKSFKANIENLFEELKLAFLWQRPSILLVVHKSRVAEYKARQAIIQKARSNNWVVMEIEPSPEYPDVARLISETANFEDTVYFVSGLDRGGGPDGKDSYRALNLGREIFVENRMKVVFWLTLEEASSLPYLAPDFWAFRHRVIEFASPSLHLSGEVLTRLLMWHDGDLPDPPRDLKEKIRNYEGLLRELPDNLDSLAMRIESQYILGHSYWAAGHLGQAIQALSSGADLARPDAFTEIRTWLLNGIAIVHHEWGVYQQTLKIYEDLGAQSRDDSILLMNMGIALCSVGRNYDGIAQSTKAARREPSKANLWNRLGHIYLLTGKFDDAISAFERAIALAPTRAMFVESLAACYTVMGITEDALGQIRKARQLQEETYPRTEIFERAVLGDPERAKGLLEAAIRARYISAASVKRDPNLNLVLDTAFLSQET